VSEVGSEQQAQAGNSHPESRFRDKKRARWDQSDKYRRATYTLKAGSEARSKRSGIGTTSTGVTHPLKAGLEARSE